MLLVSRICYYNNMIIITDRERPVKGHGSQGFSLPESRNGKITLFKEALFIIEYSEYRLIFSVAHITI